MHSVFNFVMAHVHAAMFVAGGFTHHVIQKVVAFFKKGEQAVKIEVKKL